jgi:hypothetical protein
MQDQPMDLQEHLRVGASTDHDRAAELAEYASSTDREAEAWLRWIEQRVETRMTAGHAAAIEAVALALLDHKHLSWEQFRAAVDGYSRGLSVCGHLDRQCTVM